MNEFAIRIRTRWVVVGLAGLVVAVALAAGIIWYLKSQDTFGVPREYRNMTPFPVYYVRNLPEGYAVKDGSYAYKEGMLSFVIAGPGDQRDVLVTQQLPPKDFDVDAFINKELSDPKALVTTYGKAVTGKRQGSRAAILKTDQTWILVSGSEAVPEEDFTALVDRLQKQD